MRTENKNQIIPNDFSNPNTRMMYEAGFNDQQQENQCGGCSFFAPLEEGYGLCCFEKSKYHLETVFRSFGCRDTIQEGWASHSFCEDWAPCHEPPGVMLGLLIECYKIYHANRHLHSLQHKFLYLRLKNYLSQLQKTAKKEGWNWTVLKQIP